MDYGTLQGAASLREFAILSRRRYIPVMDRRSLVPLYVLVAMLATTVGVDVLFFRHQLWPRMAVNIGIAVVFGTFYFRFLRPR